MLLLERSSGVCSLVFSGVASKLERHQLLQFPGLFSSQVHETFLPPRPQKCGGGVKGTWAILVVQPPDQELQTGKPVGQTWPAVVLWFGLLPTFKVKS